MGLVPTVESFRDSGVTIVMTADVGAEAGAPIIAVVGVESGIDAVAVTRSGSEVGLGGPLHPASDRRIKVPRRSAATLPKALPAPLNFPLIIF